MFSIDLKENIFLVKKRVCLVDDSMVMHLLLKYGDTSWISFSKRGFLPPPTFKLMKLELDENSSLYVYVCVHFLLLLKNSTKGFGGSIFGGFKN